MSIVIQKWRDAFLSWNSTDYGGITEIKLRQKDIWKPDIILDNPYVLYVYRG